MAKKLYTESDIENIADAIRTKNGSSDTYKVSEMATAIEDIPVGGLEVPADMRFGYSTFTTLPEGITFAERTSCLNMFRDCASLTTVPLFDTSSVTTMLNMFRGCTALTTVPQFDTSAVENMDYAFSQTALTTVPQFDTSAVTSMQYTFSACTALTTVPQFDTSAVQYMYYTFSNCTSLTTVPELDLSAATGMSNMFNKCGSLTNTSLQNILKSLITATSYTSTKTLKAIGLSSAQATTCTGFTEWVTLSESGWTTGY